MVWIASQMLATLSSKMPRAKGKMRWMDWVRRRRGGWKGDVSGREKGRDLRRGGGGYEERLNGEKREERRRGANMRIKVRRVVREIRMKRRGRGSGRRQVPRR